MLKAGSIADHIRKECDILITSENENRIIFFKEELLLILAAITIRKENEKELIANVVKETLHQQYIK